MARIRRRPIAQRRAAAVRDSRSTLRARFGHPPDYDYTRDHPGDPEYQAEVRAYRESIGWVDPLTGPEKTTRESNRPETHQTAGVWTDPTLDTTPTPTDPEGDEDAR